VQRGRDAVEELDDVLDDDREVFRGRAVLGCDGRYDRGCGVENTNREGLRAAPALDDAELHARAALECRDALGQGVGVQEYVSALVVAEKTEALLGVVPLDLACWHSPPLAHMSVAAPHAGTPRWRTLR
jgi:hypothetical protein